MDGSDYFQSWDGGTDTMASNQNCPVCNAPTHYIGGIERCVECEWLYPQGAD